MNALIDRGIIKEIASGNNFEYIITGDATFVDTDYKVLQSQSNDIFVKCMKITRNGLVDLCYLGNDYRTLAGMLPGLSLENANTIVAEILSCITKVKTNGFLSCQSMVLDKEKIFVDPNTMKVKMVYVPVSEKLFSTMTEFEEHLNNIINEISPDFDMADIPVVPQQVYVSGNTGNLLGAMKLTACDAPYPFEIRITEDDVLIGKKADLVDKVIDFNSAISRRHCRVIKQNGTFFIMDEGSANGTFVNNVRVEMGQKQPLQQGDIVRLANSEFRVN
ncbi:FHA domain-containing protein [Pseudobutyrivibrio sp. 49]|uniref:FHA domain-containing protein n=1 Tax=unclassified Pseudobutyrivibrio TaxID=2638619 RepID=UPI00088DB9A3|nr:MULTISPECIES: FHA domain-containing protein [unclassified Pseudobutyrivibrio]SDI35781.1 FHA domain-containing protein [Pseudobutyrivibrio sp. 49]SFN94463.1 FHA domain-containing protein [Pseudobutyrivibrio sp. UC1225]